MTRLKLAELTSRVGALVLGVGLGALFPQWFGMTAGLITAVNVGVHALGMWDTHRLEAPDQGKGLDRIVRSGYWFTEQAAGRFSSEKAAANAARC
jgi:hypothetical protein